MAEKLNLRPSERRLLVVVGLVVFVVVNIWFVWPHFGDLGKVQAKRKSALNTLGLYEEEISKKAEREAQVKALESATANVKRQDQAIELKKAVESKARAVGVDVRAQSSPQTRTNDLFFVEQSQNIETLSGEDELVAFLYDLGSGNSTIRVREFTVQPDTKRHKLSGRITLVSSFRLDEAARPKKKRGSRSATTAKK